MAHPGMAQEAAPVTTADRWNFFKEETLSPLFFVASGVTAGVAQATNSAPQYGVGTIALVKRLGASTADNLSQNFFCDFVMATAFHQNTRYYPRGPKHRFWFRVGYAVTRAFVTHTDSGANTFNWSNVVGTAMSAGLSNAYYPPSNRNTGAIVINWSTAVIGTGFGNLGPEFMPDVLRWLKRHHL